MWSAFLNKCIFVVHSEPPCRFGYNKTASLLVLDVKVLKMTTYTLTCKRSSYYGSTLSRCKFDSLNDHMWNCNLPNDKILQFMNLLSRNASAFRLVKNGRLVARSATYQGV